VKSLIMIAINLLILVSLSIFNVHDIGYRYLHTLYHNLKFISTVIFGLIPFFIPVIIIFVLSTGKWAFRVEKLSIGGFNVLFDNPNNLYKRQVRTFLDTKRTLFVVDFEHDNFKETFDSYYETYKFLRDEIKILGDAGEKQSKITKKVPESLHLYKLSNLVIRMLNNFLTTHQSDYRRWYTYMEKSDEQKFYLEPIGKLQRGYGNYAKLCDDFRKINEFFIRSVAHEFNIDVDKWREQ
jgi:hypothetical protein